MQRHVRRPRRSVVRQQILKIVQRQFPEAGLVHQGKVVDHPKRRPSTP